MGQEAAKSALNGYLRPDTEMFFVKKLEKFGNIYLAVTNGEVKHMHPRRKKLAGAKQGELYDILSVVQSKQLRGSIWVDKPLSCSPSVLSKVANLNLETWMRCQR